MDIILKYFPDLTEKQIKQFTHLEILYKEWNKKINVISRKDVEEIYLRHVLHSLAIAKVYPFPSDAKIADIGTGGGFPGIPLAILFPKTKFTLIDSIGKKIKVVNEVATGLNLKNVKTYNCRIEELPQTFDYIVSRAVAKMDTFVHWTQNKFNKTSNCKTPNGIFYLKGGNLKEELQHFPKAKIHNISDFFTEDFFETKKIVYLKI